MNSKSACIKMPAQSNILITSGLVVLPVWQSSDKLPNYKNMWGDDVKLILSCYCCGKTDFEYIASEDYRYEIEGETYLHSDDISDLYVKCKACGLIDYVKNLVIKVK